jgi:glutamyl-tRNA reductase
LDFSTLKEKLNPTSGEQAKNPEERNKLLDKLAILGEKEFYNLDNNGAKKEILNTIKELKKIYISNRKREIEQLISQAEKQEDDQRVNELMKELKTLSDEYNLEQ